MFSIQLIPHLTLQFLLPNKEAEWSLICLTAVLDIGCVLRNHLAPMKREPRILTEKVKEISSEEGAAWKLQCNF